MGYDCSSAAALQNMNMRNFALPFDWVQSNVHAIEACFRDDFAKYHTNLRLNAKKTRLIDAYGFQFPHDYHTSGDITPNVETVGEGVYAEKEIVANWTEFYDTVKCKYDRRIERFRRLVQDPHPIVVLCRYPKEDVFLLKELFAKYYNKTNVRFINSSNEIFTNEFMVNIHTEQNGEWNETAIWKSAVDAFQ